MRGALILALCALSGTMRAGESPPGIAAEESRHGDARLRSAAYDPVRVYRLRGYVGYQIDLEFEVGESFIGLSAGDVEAVGFAAQANHLFLKPKATRVRTNLTVLTSRRSYHFDYEVLSSAAPESLDPALLYALRFIYPSVERPDGAALDAHALARTFDLAAPGPQNRNYWYCGDTALLPVAAYDDGVHTHLRFNARAELPAIFVRNDDGSESLLNFSVEAGEVVIHRIARRLIVRRGRLQGCILNRGFEGVGRELQSGTVSPQIERSTREPAP